jgi:hypothetical protein
MMNITRIALPKEQLQKLTDGERSLFLLLGHSSNQINALWKLVVVATNDGAKDPVEEKVSAAQTQIFVRLLIGIMREALKLVEKRFLGSTLGKEYQPRLSAEATEALGRLKKRFGAPDKLVMVRDNFAFHHPALEDMEAAFQLRSNLMATTRTGACTWTTRCLIRFFSLPTSFWHTGSRTRWAKLM